MKALTRSFTAGSASRVDSGVRLNRNSRNFRIETVSYCVLAEVMTFTSAPIASRLLLCPTRRRVSQWFVVAVSLCRM